jgi:SAM-dependent methyltransferase
LTTNTKDESECNVDYMHFIELWEGYEDLLVKLGRRQGSNAVAELGGGANPMVADTERWGFVPHRVVIDISADELAKAEGHVETRVADLCQPIRDGHNSYDLVFSKMLCEHLPDPRAFHENCFNLLRPGGLAVHFFPTLYTVPFVANRVIPESTARALLGAVQPRRIHHPKHQKFPAYYRWCTGPSRRSTRRYRSVGFEITQWKAAFGHDYYIRIPPVEAMERTKTKLLLRRPIPHLTSFAVVVLRKPD